MSCYPRSVYMEYSIYLWISSLVIRYTMPVTLRVIILHNDLPHCWCTCYPSMACGLITNSFCGSIRNASSPKNSPGPRIQLGISTNNIHTIWNLLTHVLPRGSFGWWNRVSYFILTFTNNIKMVSNFILFDNGLIDSHSHWFKMVTYCFNFSIRPGDKKWELNNRISYWAYELHFIVDLLFFDDS